VSRLAATLRLDAQLQARNNVYAIVVGTGLAIALALRAFFTPDQLQFFMPLVALSGVGITAFVLIGILVLLERGEGTLDVVLVSPLRPAEYLASKVSTLTALAIFEAALIVGVAYGLNLSVPWLVLAVILRASFVAAVGLAVGVRYRSITQYLLPLALLSIAFDLPILWYLELWPSPVFYLWPTMPSLLLAKAAFAPVEPMQLLYAVVYGTLVIAAAVAWALRSLDRFVVRGERS
jgi:fluoroquinolone transport system permease protein